MAMAHVHNMYKLLNVNAVNHECGKAGSAEEPRAVLALLTAFCKASGLFQRVSL